MKHTLSFFLLAVALFTSSSYSRILNVPLPYITIQAAINSAVSGDTILVADGIYYENINFQGKGITIASRFIVDGGESHITSTVINGSMATNTDSASVVRICGTPATVNDTGAALIGFTISGGKGTRWEDEHSLGSYYREGGGILIQYLSPRIKNNLIVDNDASNATNCTSSGGGGIRCGDGNPTIEGNIFFGNKGRYGGGLVLNYSGATIRNNIFYKNSGGEDYGGGGLWILANGVNPVNILNNTIVANSSTSNGGGIKVWSSTVSGKNNIVWGNISPTSAQIRLQQGVLTFTNSDVQDGFAGAGNLNSDPLLELQFLTLGTGSPCIDAGDTSVVYNDKKDMTSITPIALFPSRGGLRNDMGAFGGKYARFIPTILTTIKDSELKLTADGFSLLQNYPNPFNPSTTITFKTIKAGHVSLKIFDILGCEMATLLDADMSAGMHSVDFSANDLNLSSGMYFYRLQEGNSVIVKKMLYSK